jgi:hypothetical protein
MLSFSGVLDPDSVGSVDLDPNWESRPPKMVPKKEEMIKFHVEQLIFRILALKTLGLDPD